MFRNEQHCEKICLQGFRLGYTHTGLYNHRRGLQALNFRFMKYRDCSIYEAKTKVLISCAATVHLICAFVFTYAKSQFSHDAQIAMVLLQSFCSCNTNRIISRTELARKK